MSLLDERGTLPSVAHPVRLYGSPPPLDGPEPGRVSMLTRIMPALLSRIGKELDTRIRGLARAGARAATGLRSRVGASGVDESTGAAARRPSQPRRAATPRRQQAPRGQTQAKVLKALEAAPGSTAAAVAKASGVPTNVAAATISRLVKQGRVRRLEGGGYTVVEADTGRSPSAAPVASAKADADQRLSE